MAATFRGHLIVDTQTRHLPAGARRLLSRAAGRRHPPAAVFSRTEDPYFDLHHRLELMDALGVTAAAVSLMPFRPLDDSAATIRLAAIANDGP